MNLWAYALAAWDRPGVRQASLALQDGGGQCVVLLLWRGWAATEGRPVDAALAGEAVELARDWQREVIAPLRAARRALSNTFKGLDAARRAPCRAAARAAELAAEQALLEALEAKTPAPSGPAGDLRAALAAVMQIWDPGAPIEAARPLAEALQ